MIEIPRRAAPSLTLLFQNGRLCEDALRYAGGSLAETDLYREGKIAIQDEAIQMVAVLLDPQPGERSGIYLLHIVHSTCE